MIRSWEYGTSSPGGRIVWFRSESVARESAMEQPPPDAHPGDFPVTLWRRRVWRGRTRRVAVGPQQGTRDDEQRPLQVGDEILMFPIVDGRDAIRAMFDPHNPPRTTSPYETGVCPECGRLVEIAWVDATMPVGAHPAVRVPGRWICRTVGCKYGEPATTITIHLDNASGTFTPTGPRYEFGEEKAT